MAVKNKQKSQNVYGNKPRRQSNPEQKGILLGVITILDFKLYYRTVVIKIA